VHAVAPGELPNGGPLPLPVPPDLLEQVHPWTHPVPPTTLDGDHSTGP
jgi:hypothetical protein